MVSFADRVALVEHSNMAEPFGPAVADSTRTLSLDELFPMVTIAPRRRDPRIVGLVGPSPIGSDGVTTWQLPLLPES